MESDGLHLGGGVHLEEVGAHLKGGPQREYITHYVLLNIHQPGNFAEHVIQIPGSHNLN